MVLISFTFGATRKMTCITGVWGSFPLALKVLFAKLAFVTGVTPDFIDAYRSWV
jgi:hypothetical protein